MARLPQGVIAFNVGPGLVGQCQGLWSSYHRRSGRLAIYQPVEPVEDVGLGRHTVLQRQFHRHQHGLLVMVKHQGQDLHHLPIATNTAQEVVLQSLECLRQFQERGTVAQGTRLSLDHRQVMTPVIHGPPWPVMGPVDDARVLADDMAFRRDHKPAITIMPSVTAIV